MTENEAINVLKMVEAHGSLTSKAKEMAIQALAEIQEYRAIGTVRQVQDFIADWRKYREFGTLKDIEKSMKNVSVLSAEHELLKLYQAIGTIEEFKALKEKMEELHKIVMCEQQSTSCEYTKLKSFEMIENILCET